METIRGKSITERHENRTVKKFSNKNTYSDSTGKRYTRSEIESKIRKAKALKIEMMLADIGYIRCEDCKKNNSEPIDCSHNISVNDCLNAGRSEVAWDTDNITMRCRPCHRIWDNS